MNSQWGDIIFSQALALKSWDIDQKSSLAQDSPGENIEKEQYHSHYIWKSGDTIDKVLIKNSKGRYIFKRIKISLFEECARQSCPKLGNILDSTPN